MDRKFYSLQALRGVAALLVLLFHYRFYLRGDDNSGTSLWDALFGWGIIGVNIFFVISGFIMVYTTHHYRSDFSSSKRFLINRAVRILPLYYFGLLIAFLLGGAMSTFHYPEKVQNLISALTFTVYRTDVTPHYIDDGGMYNIRWTLNYEIYFHLVFGLCLLIRNRFIALISWGALATCIIPAIAGFQPTLNIQGYHVESPLYGLLSNPIILAFLIGAIAAYLYFGIRQKITSVHLPLFSALLSLVIFLYLAWGIYTHNIRALDTWSSVIIGLFVLTLTLGDSVLRKFTPAILIYLGNISFSLYLLHNPVGWAVLKRFEFSDASPVRAVLAVILATAASIIAAHFTYQYIEVRFTRWLKKKLLPLYNAKMDAIPLEKEAR